MISKEVTVTNSVGLHARPATYFIQKANTYKSSVWIEHGDRRANAKSLLGVLSLGIMGGTTIRILAGGPDEETAVEEASFDTLVEDVSLETSLSEEDDSSDE